MHALKNINLVAHSHDLLKVVSKDVINLAKNRLPDLRSIIIFVPKQYTQAALQNSIIKEAKKQGLDAIFQPNIVTLKQWVISQSNFSKPFLSQYARELILVDAIKQKSDLFSNTNPWAIANELLTLFDEMSLNEVPASGFDEFHEHINNELSDALLQETNLVKILWQAWRDQIQQENYIDPNEAYANALRTLIPEHDKMYFCVALNKLSRLEIKFINKLDQQAKLVNYIYASSKELHCYSDEWLKKYVDHTTATAFIENIDDHVITNFFDEAFKNNDVSIKDRARAFANKFPSESFKNSIKIYKNNRFEQHAKAIDIQIRLWIEHDIQNIGVVTNDRKLIRRLRALLEHANIIVNDPGGWALSTTSAAVVIEWWLLIIEEHFPSKQLIALTRSPFFPVNDTDLHLKALNFFEKEVVLRNNIRYGLSNYRYTIEHLYQHDENL